MIGRGSPRRRHVYLIGGLRVASSRQLSAIPEADDGEVHLELTWVDAPLLERGGALRTLPGGRMSVLTTASPTYRLQDGLEFEVLPDGHVIRIWSRREAGLVLTHLVVDTVLPLFLSTVDRVVLHGAGLLRKGGAVGVVGESGSGKSTLASYWVSRGGGFLSDDWFCLRFVGEEIVVDPSHPSVRLRNRDMPFLEEAAIPHERRQEPQTKHWYSFHPESPPYDWRPHRLVKLVFATRDDSCDVPELRRMRPRDAAMMLLSKVFLLETESPSRWRCLLGSIRKITDLVPVEELRFPSGIRGLEKATALISD